MLSAWVMIMSDILIRLLHFVPAAARTSSSSYSSRWSMFNGCHYRLLTIPRHKKSLIRKRHSTTPTQEDAKIATEPEYSCPWLWLSVQERIIAEVADPASGRRENALYEYSLSLIAIERSVETRCWCAASSTL